MQFKWALVKKTTFESVVFQLRWYYDTSLVESEQYFDDAYAHPLRYCEALRKHIKIAIGNIEWWCV